MSNIFYKLSLGFLIAAAMASCGGTPGCIDDRIDLFMTNSGTCKGASVIKYRFNGDIVYAFTQGQCIADGATSIVDEDCNDICLLGGIAGFTECGEGMDFLAFADEIEIIYQVK